MGGEGKPTTDPFPLTTTANKAQNTSVCCLCSPPITVELIVHDLQIRKVDSEGSYHNSRSRIILDNQEKSGFEWGATL